VADYSFEESLADTCTVCGINAYETVLRDGYSLLKYIAPISERCPVATIVGVCQRCLLGRPRGDDKRLFLADDAECDWSPPPLLGPIDGEPVYVVGFGHVDDHRLAETVQRAIRRLPRRVIGRLRAYLAPEFERTVDDYLPRLHKGALRVEALRVFPGSRRVLGQCMRIGHTIRLSASAVNTMPDAILLTLVIHELAHVYQHAAWRRDRIPDVEDDAKQLMAKWGFNNAAIDRWLDSRSEERWRAKWRRMKQRLARESEDDPENG
jgi:hypothetical protein